MKKILVVLASLTILTGCLKINNAPIDKIVDASLQQASTLTNQYRTGYKYYLPRGLSIVNKSDYNEQFNTDIYSYYMYVDIVSYYNNVKEEYQINKDAYYSKEIKAKNRYGYIEINEIKDKYLVEIMYNYAKIEVIVRENDINSTISNSLAILNSIQYNDKIIANIMGENVLYNKETEINIFKTKKTESNYINYEEMYGQYDASKDTHDSDLID